MGFGISFRMDHFCYSSDEVGEGVKGDKALRDTFYPIIYSKTSNLREKWGGATPLSPLWVTRH